MEEINFLSIALMVMVAAASGLVGTFALMRKMALAADAISHVALPGLGLAIIYKIDPLIGGGLALLLGAIFIWVIEKKTSISTETIVGVVFSASLAVGSLVTPDHELIEALFGEVKALTLYQAGFGILAAFLVIAFVLWKKNQLALSLISEDLAIVSGIKVSKLDLSFLLVFSLNVILGLQFLGVLLMGSLIIVPAAIGRNLGHSLNTAMVISVLAAITSVVGGYVLSGLYNIEVGPTIISVATGLFFVSFLRRYL